MSILFIQSWIILLQRKAMFFNIHFQSIIGYKKLSDAELAIRSGNQTPIGLFENTLEFASSHHQISTSQLIYNNNIMETQTFLDYIKTPNNGSFRSPKIRSDKVNTLNLSYIEELELLIQTDEEQLNSRIKPKQYDIQKAQKIFFSSQELKFIQQHNHYLIRRVYGLNETPKLRVSNNIEIVSHDFVDELNIFSRKIKHTGLNLNSMKVHINPNYKTLNFDNEIIL